MKNVTFVDPLEILDKRCGTNMKSYLECFRDSDHMSEKSSKELLDFFMKNYLRPLPPKNFMSTNQFQPTLFSIIAPYRGISIASYL